MPLELNMTVERRISVGLDDLKAVSLECNGCHVRLSFPPDFKGDVPLSCERCGHAWRGSQTISGFRESSSVLVSFVQAIPPIRTLLKEAALGFRVLLEFDEPQ